MKLRGFTLIELLVVIAIIGILASIVMVSLSGGRAKGHDAKRVADLGQIARLMALSDNGPAITVTCTGGANIDNLRDVSTCSGVGAELSNFKDPSNSTTACQDTNGPTENNNLPCQYAISRERGQGGTITNQDWEVCSNLEVGIGSYSAGMIYVSSATSSPAQVPGTGCY
jgi:prepilin-type N-terminal cleavage/methylation domain-containing protein